MADSQDVLNKISNFVEQIRIDSKQGTPAGDRRTPVRATRGNENPVDDPEPSTSRGRVIGDRIVVDAEQHKAAVHAPRGKEFNFERFLHNIDDDDEFFHVTCHIDSGLRSKIARGEFVDLEKLLPKDKTGGGGNISLSAEENKVELVSRGGHTYFKPVNETHITGLRKWEQAFRIYAAIYTEANLERSVEIWQYMHVINVAASAYQWDNVASYDLTFRQLMAFKPKRSWAKTYNQGWNLAMRDPITKGQSVKNSSSNNNKHDWRDDCCWRFNRNRCQKDAHSCHYDHWCTYCGGWNHGFYNCRKRLRKEGNNNSNNNNGSNIGSHNNNHRGNNNHYQTANKRKGGSPKQ